MNPIRSSFPKFYHVLFAGILATSLLGCNEEYDNTDRDAGYVADTAQDTNLTQDTDTSQEDSGDTQETCSDPCTDDQICIETQCVTLATLALGRAHTCALLPANKIKCWGANNVAQLGQGEADEDAHPIPLSVDSGFSDRLSGIYANTNQTCVKTAVSMQSEDEVWCWGTHHALPDISGSTNTAENPERLPDVTFNDKQIHQLALGESHSCALYHDGNVRCWGGNSIYGQLGFIPTGSTSYLSPLDIKDLPPATQITAGSDFTCALTGDVQDHSVYCWGINHNSTLGQKDAIEYSETPLLVLGLTNVLAVESGSQHTCAILNDEHKSIQCWGYNSNGQLGIGTFDSADTPQAPKNNLRGVKQLALGTSFTCALLDSGQVACTGSNLSEQLGRPESNGIGKYNTFEVIPGLNNVHKIVAGSVHICAVHDDNKISCWGKNDKGQVGSKNAETVSVPTEISLK